MPALEHTISTIGGNPGEVNTIFVSVGPGSFTGLRVAIATAKMISYTTSAMVVPVETALGVVCADLESTKTSIVVSVVKQETCWLSVVTKKPIWRCEGRLVNISTLHTYIEQGCVLYGDSFLPDEIIQNCKDVGVPIRTLQSTATAIMNVGRTFGKENHVDPTLLLPIYPREPEAVRKWKEVRLRSN